MTRSKTLHCVFERDKGMREVDVNEIIKNIKEMCIEANHFLSKDMKEVYDAKNPSFPITRATLCL